MCLCCYPGGGLRTQRASGTAAAAGHQLAESGLSVRRVDILPAEGHPSPGVLIGAQMNPRTVKTLAVLGVIGSGVGLSGSLGFYGTESAYLSDHPTSDLATVLQAAALSMILVAGAALLLSIGLFGVASHLARLQKAEQWIALAAPIVADAAAQSTSPLANRTMAAQPPP